MTLDKDKLYQEIGRRVRATRTARGVTQKDLAKRVGLKRDTISCIEGGTKRARIGALYEIALALNTGISNLVPGKQAVTSEEPGDPE